MYHWPSPSTMAKSRCGQIAGEARPVGLQVALLCLPDSARHRRPRLAAHQFADLTAHGSTGVVDDIDIHPEGRAAQRAAADGSTG